jgi:hypothetical protein
LPPNLELAGLRRDVCEINSSLVSTTAPYLGLRQIPFLLRGQVDYLSAWLTRFEPARTVLHLAVIVIGSGLYGAAMGAWRAPLQAAFGALKFPIAILLTTFGTGMINGMFAPLLGLNLSFRQTTQAVLMSFVIASAILGAFSPIIAFLVWSSPPLQDASANASTTHAFIKLANVAAIAFAGVAANLRLYQLLRRLSGNARTARRVLCAWLAMNLLLGSQLVWVLRPFIGSPSLPVQFLRPNAFEGNFYETVLRDLMHLFSF